jgi:hypothetical protein
LTLAGLALIGGLAAACFAKAYGIVFLGHPRSQHAADATETGAGMYLPMGVLAAACIGIGLIAPLFFRLVFFPLAILAPAAMSEAPLVLAAGQLRIISFFSAAVILAGLVLALVRRLVLTRRTIGREPTWGCGYLHPNARMQYTASSFARPITLFFDSILRSRVTGDVSDELVVDRLSLHTSTPDPLTRFFYVPIFTGTSRFFGLLRWMQHGRVQLYILYIVITLFLLLTALAGGWL